MPDATRPRWLRVVLGLVVGVLVAVAAFGVVIMVRDEPVVATHRLGNDDAMGPGPVSLINVRDVRQPSSIPGVAAPTGERYVSVVEALERQDATAQQWFTLEDFTVAVHAVDGAGEREELTPTETSRRLLEGIGGRVSGVEPYWIQLEYEAPSGAVDVYEVDLGVDDDDYTFTVHPEGSA